MHSFHINACICSSSHCDLRISLTQGMHTPYWDNQCLVNALPTFLEMNHWPNHIYEFIDSLLVSYSAFLCFAIVINRVLNPSGSTGPFTVFLSFDVTAYSLIQIKVDWNYHWQNKWLLLVVIVTVFIVIICNNDSVFFATSDASTLLAISIPSSSLSPNSSSIVTNGFVPALS